MSELHVIEGVLKKAALRRRLERAWRGFWQGLFAGGLVWLVVYGCYKVFPILPVALIYAGAVAGFILLVSIFVRFFQTTSLLETARWLDLRRQLQERLSTALEVAKSGPESEWKTLVMNDAAQHAREVDARKLVPMRLPGVARWALLVVVLGASLGFVPKYRSQQYIQKQVDLANIHETGKQLADFIKRTAEQRPPVLEPTQKALDTVAEMGQKLTKANLTRSEAVRDIANLSDKISQQAKELAQNPALKPLERAAREREDGTPGSPTPEGLQKQMEAMQKALGNAAGKPDAIDKLKSNLEKVREAMAKLPDKDSAAAKAGREQLAQSMSELAKQARDMGQPLESLEEAIKALEKSQTDLAIRDLDNALTDLDKLRDMAKALQQLQQQASKLGKDLAEQLKNGQAQAAQQTLQKMIDQMKNSNLSKEQLQKIADEVSKAVDPAGQYGKVAEHLKNALQQMAACNKPDKSGSEQQQAKSGAAQSLSEAAKELEKLQQQMADAQAMQDAMEALQRAQMAIASGKNWSECEGGKCSNCNGEGCEQCRGKGWGKGGKPGSGVGTWADETGWSYFPDKMQPVDNTGVTRPDMDPRGHSDRGDGELNSALTPTKVKGQFSKGGPMPSITLKGVNIKGQSTVQYEEAAAAAQTDAQNALNQDQVPRPYRNAVRDYFDDLKK